MLDIKFLRSNPEVVKQNIKNKFQDEKLPLVDEVIELDKRNREIKQEVETLRAEKNKASKQIGAMMAQKKLDEAEALKKKVAESAGRIDELSVEEKDVEEKIKKIMMTSRISLILLCRSERTTAKMWSLRDSGSLLFRILKFRIIQI